MKLNENDILVPVLSGPNKQKLERAINALAEAKKVEEDFYANAAARGEHPTCITGNDYDYQSVVLMRTYLRWSLKGRIFRYSIHEPAKRIAKLKDGYTVEFSHHNQYARILKASSGVVFALEPDTSYDFRIVYNPDTKVGHLSMLGKSAI
ncbi:hypothetical protein J5500_00285 [Candidatus Saccharibacteria bacterium]|nr:hypothetical protein [Candidatus Saccharibacteria bacterium]